MHLSLKEPIKTKTAVAAFGSYTAAHTLPKALS